jgi:hypothetical protein
MTSSLVWHELGRGLGSVLGCTGREPGASGTGRTKNTFCSPPEDKREHFPLHMPLVLTACRRSYS